MMQAKYLWPLIGVVSWAPCFAQDSCSIKVRSVAVREKSSYLSKVVGNLDYAQQVIVLEQQNNWGKIELNKVSGWIPMTSLSAPKVKFELPEEKKETKKQGFGLGNVFSKKAEISDSEIAMAGKAWENDIPLAEGEGNYKLVDEMEKRQVDTETKIKYLEALKTGAKP